MQASWPPPLPKQDSAKYWGNFYQFWRRLGFVDTLSHSHRLTMPVMLSAGGADVEASKRLPPPPWLVPKRESRSLCTPGCSRAQRRASRQWDFYGYWQPALKSPAPLLINLPGYGGYMSLHPLCAFFLYYSRITLYAEPDGPSIISMK